MNWKPLSLYIGIFILVCITSILIFRFVSKSSIQSEVKKAGMLTGMVETPSKIIKDPVTGLIFNKIDSILYSAKKIGEDYPPKVNTLVQGICYSNKLKSTLKFDLNLVSSTPSEYVFENDPLYINKINSLDIDEIRLYYYKRVPYNLSRNLDGSPMFKKDEISGTCYAYGYRVSEEPANVKTGVILTSYALDPYGEGPDSQIPIQIRLFLDNATSIDDDVIRLDFVVPDDDYDSILQFNDLLLQYSGGKLFYENLI